MSHQALILGADLVKRIEASADVASEIIMFLISRQTNDEILKGTSIHRNGVGLTKDDANRIDREGVPKNERDLKNMAIKYTTQVAQAILDGSFVLAEELPVEGAREEKLALIERGDADAEEGEEEEEEEEEVLSTTSVAMFKGERPVLLSARFCKLVYSTYLSTIDGVRVIYPTEFMRGLLDAVNEKFEWCGQEVDMEMIDMAMYMQSDPLIIDESLAGSMVRVFWSSERQWVSARVIQVRKSGHPCATVDLEFTDEDKVGSVSGTEALYMYSLKYSEKVPVPSKRRRLARVVVEEEDDL
jgi:predicted transcriptional regulator